MDPNPQLRSPPPCLTLPAPAFPQRHSTGHPAVGLEAKLGGFGLSHDADKERAAREELKDAVEREHRRQLLELEKEKLAVEKAKLAMEEKNAEQRERHHRELMEQHARTADKPLPLLKEQTATLHDLVIKVDTLVTAQVDANGLHRYVADCVKAGPDQMAANQAEGPLP